MRSDLGAELRAVLFDVAATYWKLAETVGPSTAQGPVGAAIVAVLNRIDDTLLALPTPEDLRLALVDRHPFLGDTREREAGAAGPLRLDLDAAREVCSAIVAHDEALEALLMRIREAGPPDVHTYFRKLIGSVIEVEYRDFLAPLTAQHLELASIGKPPADA
jgi:hypothetical protein